jgi:hypothetical protein
MTPKNKGKVKGKSKATARAKQKNRKGKSKGQSQPQEPEQQQQQISPLRSLAARADSGRNDPFRNKTKSRAEAACGRGRDL